MPPFVLVHSPLVGPLSWAPVAAILGAGTVVASLADAGGPPYYPAFAQAVADVAPDGAVLVAHSGAGALLAAAADLIESRGDGVGGLIYVDALLPYPGRTWFDTAPPGLAEHLRGLAEDGVLRPWDEWFPAEAIASLLPDPGVRGRFSADLPRLPLAYFAETAPDVTDRPGAYLRLSEGYVDEAAEAEKRGWPVVVEDADHLAVVTRPELVAERIRELWQRL
ncbi:alpha/beta fold hydrolase [Phytomonospora endophytica]|uniref:AB hydrolase-1 domain-containing protein n=1 Tax=Phytomonospora endophytica TaxID=714109 RepID=A0A841FJ66_9ACTN|nr:alpha/beta fold hydrolase [Phytomonospora endophytica]MBB6035855.1 hypothetical protein [Phytomonospora endophytica]GIG71150.1 hypothetical protein Pen01_74450 [Phytomonospora endophytica]